MKNYTERSTNCNVLQKQHIFISLNRGETAVFVGITFLSGERGSSVGHQCPDFHTCFISIITPCILYPGGKFQGRS